MTFSKKLISGLCLFILMLALFSTFVQATENTSLVRTDRYSLETLTPSQAELDPLSVTVQMNFPPHVYTVRDAVQMVMEPSGWVLAEDKANDSALTIVLDRPLPEVHRRLSKMPLRTVLQVLVGQYFEPVEDPIRRIYTFDLNSQFRGLLDVE
ncbi:hypothetical protein [Vibrio fluvialis]|uniref:PFGI-1 class ICE element type IV pilus protein PilL2 n=1 Tax=Vibrio fluvialis TaxID=676 RepID=UPI00192B0CF9|nr:hypothetical protein [Vibrio fluvialis]